MERVSIRFPSPAPFRYPISQVTEFAGILREQVPRRFLPEEPYGDLFSCPGRMCRLVRAASTSASECPATGIPIGVGIHRAFAARAPWRCRPTIRSGLQAASLSEGVARLRKGTGTADVDVGKLLERAQCAAEDGSLCEWIATGVPVAGWISAP